MQLDTQQYVRLSTYLILMTSLLSILQKGKQPSLGLTAPRKMAGMYRLWINWIDLTDSRRST